MSKKYLMKPARIVFIIFFGTIYFLQFIHAQDPVFSQRQLTVIHLEAKGVLENYENYINQLGEAIMVNPDRTREIRERFMELFTSHDVWVFNDLDPEHKTSPFFEAETYVNNLELSYPDGISTQLHMDHAKIGQIINHGNNRFSVDLRVGKQIYGNYLNRLVNTNLETLLFRVGFIEKDGEFQNFRIIGIRSLDVDIVPNLKKKVEEISAQKLEPSENDLLIQGVTSLINDYSNYLSLIGSNQETNFDKEHYANSFKMLFEFPDTMVYNDLVPEPVEKYVNLDDYLNLLRNHYPTGIYRLSLTIDSSTLLNVIQERNDRFRVNVGIDKFFSGVYNRQSIFRNESKLIMKISFKKENRVFEDYRIQSIESEEEDFLEAQENFVMPENELTPVRRKGFHLISSGSFSQTWIQDLSLLDLNMRLNGQVWHFSPGYGANAGLGIQAYFNNNIAIETGIYLNQYRTTFCIDGDFMDLKLSADVNGDDFYKKMDLLIDSTVNYDLFSAPLLFTFITSRPGRTGFYFTIGGSVTYSHSGHYHMKGSCDYYGYYPDNPQVIKEIRIEELGFYYMSELNEKDKIECGQVHFSAISSFGLVIPVKYFTQIYLGPQVEWGLTDFHADRMEQPDIFGEMIVHRPTYLYRVGFKIGVSVHL